MPVNPTYPGLYIEELPSASRVITAAPTSITAFVGYAHPFQGECAEQGLWETAIRIFNFAEYERKFGGIFQSSFIDTNLGHAVSQFFVNGGADAYVFPLEPRYYDLDNLPTAADIKPATGAAGTVTFEAKQLTNVTKMEITVANARSSPNSGGALDIADIVVTWGSQVEAFSGVRLGAPADKNDIRKRLQGSRLVKIPLNPALPQAFVNATLTLTTMPVSGFNNETTSIDADYLKAFQADSALDKVDIFNLLVLPGVASEDVWSKAIKFCEDKRAFYIIDPPSDATADGAGQNLLTIEKVMTDDVPKGTPNGAIYFPYLKANDPLTNTEITLPPSGSIAGLYARTDTRRGVWKAPAGLEAALLGTTGIVPEGVMTDMRQGTLNPIGVNVLRSFPGSGTVIWGARTTVTNNPSYQQWRYVPVRRTALFIENSLIRNLGWVVFEPNDEPLWSAIRLSIEGFMLSLFRQQAFQGRTPSQAFLVQCDSSTTTQTDIDNGIVNILVGFRPLKPAEFVIIKIQQLAGQVQA